MATRKSSRARDTFPITYHEKDIGASAYDVYYEFTEDYEVTGVHIPHRKNYILSNVDIIDSVEIYHQKSNKFSDKAIAVKHGNKVIGYISEIDIEKVWPILEKEHQAFIAAVDYFDNYLAVEITIEYN